VIRLLKKLLNRYNGLGPKLLQMHHQSKTNYKSEMVSQREIWCEAQMQEWWKETAKEHPLPEGFQWMVCNFDSPYFVKTDKNKETK